MRKSFIVFLALAVVLAFSCIASGVTSYQFIFQDPGHIYYPGVLPAGYYNFLSRFGPMSSISAEPLYYSGGGISDYVAEMELWSDDEFLGTVSIPFQLGVLGDATVIINPLEGFDPNASFFLEFVSSAVSVPSVDLAADISVLSDFFDNFGIGALLSFFAAGISVSVGLVLLWFGFRYLTRKIIGALRRGRV